jgi:hypothetical protein
MRAEGLEPPRSFEHGPGQTTDLRPDPACVDFAPANFIELAANLA